MVEQNRMYAAAKTWNPFKGCKFDCTYCGPSFKQQSKRTKNRCAKCGLYVPHCHEDRLDKIPAAEIVFTCGNADISFCPPSFARKIIHRIREHISSCRKSKTFYLQSKRPVYFEPFLDQLPPEVILVTTLETNRDRGYHRISKAPPPSERFRQFKNLDYPRKVVTVEPVMDFDAGVFSRWLTELSPEYVWLGLNSRPKQVQLPEPSEDKLREFVGSLQNGGITIRAKDLRGLDVGIAG